MATDLLASFPLATKPLWRERFEKELGGRPYADALRRVSDSVVADPYYVRQEVRDVALVRDIQQCQRQQPGWWNTPVVPFQSAEQTNRAILRHLEAGADAVWMTYEGSSVGALDLPRILHGVRLTDAPVFFDAPVSVPELVGGLTKGSGYYLKGGVVGDPLVDWMRAGRERAGRDRTGAFDGIAEAIARTKAMREFRCYQVESHVFHEAGADPVQELAFLLSGFVTCLDELTDREVPPLLAATRLVFSVSVGTDYLTEIAKLRALRYLYKKITRAYQLPDELCHPFVRAQSSRLYQSARSPHTNLIRHSSEALSAVMGGCDALSILPYDAKGAEAGGTFSERLARNIPLVLRHEGFLDKVSDPAAGSYYLETLTAQLSDAAWRLFLNVEEKGGLEKAFKQNYIQETIGAARARLLQNYRSGRVMVGVNKYRQDDDAPESTPSGPKYPPQDWERLVPLDLDRELQTPSE